MAPREQAIATIKHARSIAEPNPAFAAQLAVFEKECRGVPSGGPSLGQVARTLHRAATAVHARMPAVGLPRRTGLVRDAGAPDITSPAVRSMDLRDSRRRQAP